MNKHIYEDPRYVDIGDLPTGFFPYSDLSKIYARPFVVRELALLHLGSRTKNLEHIIRAVNMAISCDASTLTDGDFEFIMAWLRLSSFPESPLLVTWHCRKNNLVYSDDKRFYKKDPRTVSQATMLIEGLEHELCGTENKTIVHQATTEIEAFDADLEPLDDPEIDYARIGTLVARNTYVKENPGTEHIADVARWVKGGSTFKEKLAILNESDIGLYERIDVVRKRYLHGIFESMELRCRTCENRLSHTSGIDYSTFFADNTDQDLLDIQYTLMERFGLQPDDDMPAKTLLYHHSCYVKDLKAEEERRRIQQSAQSR